MTTIETPLLTVDYRQRVATLSTQGLKLSCASKPHFEAAIAAVFEEAHRSTIDSIVLSFQGAFIVDDEAVLSLIGKVLHKNQELQLNIGVTDLSEKIQDKIEEVGFAKYLSIFENVAQAFVGKS